MSTFDLLDVPRGAKEAANCDLKMLNSDNYPKFNLMKQKSARGWFPIVTKNQKSEDILAVSELLRVIIDKKMFRRLI